MKLQHLDLQTLSHGLNTTAARSSVLSALVKKLYRFGAALVDWLSADNELQIYQTTNRSGQTSWIVKDASREKTVCLSSEQEVRAYLESRHLYSDHK